jgi:ABC-type glycerol-3-phosphate transport system permease component
MALIPEVGRKKGTTRAFILFIYAALVVLGLTMVVPFFITVTSSTTNNFDYERFWPVPRYFWSSKDRYVKGLVYFFNRFRGWNDQMRTNIPGMPSHWTSWSSIGRDIQAVDKTAEHYLKILNERPEKERIVAADYSRFCDQLPLSETTVTVINPQAVNFIAAYYQRQLESEQPEQTKKLGRKGKSEASLKLLSQKWGLPYESFYNVNFLYELNSPMDFQTWYPPLDNPKYQDFLRLKNAYRAQIFTPGVRSKWLHYLKKQKYAYKDTHSVFPVTEHADQKLHELWGDFKAANAPASPTIPFALRAAWFNYLTGEEVTKNLGIKAGEKFDVARYNELAGTRYESLDQTAFPIPAEFKPGIQRIWRRFVETRYPLRLTSLKVTPALRKSYQALLRKEIKHLRIANELLGRQHTAWEQFELSPTAPMGLSEIENNRRNVWNNFVKALPMEERQISCSEMRYQEFLLKKYGSLAEVNRVYGWNLERVQEAFPPFMSAYTVTFLNNEGAFTFSPIFYNYKVIFEYLILNARALPVTFYLIVLTILCTLTVNPLAAYSMSRFNLRGQDKLILFMLATMAFPAMVSAIPAYLLMRDLGLLNTFFALVLPGAANGMAIFILKGFFDSLPQELFEAATIDGASEFQIFRIVAMPLVKPILAINCLTAFITAYNGWQWALIICQDKKMWTIAVWLYQASRWWASMPWIVSAGFVVASVPTFLVFVSCQKMILRGIVIPSMK